MKLRTKIHLFTTLLTLVLLVLMNSGVYLLYEQLAINTEYKQLKTRGEELLSTFNGISDTAGDPDTVLRAYMPTDGAIRVVTDGGAEILSIASPTLGKVQEMQLDNNEPYSVVDSNGIPVIMIETPAIWTDGAVVTFQLQQRLADVSNTLYLLKLILIAVTILIAIPLLLSNMALSRIILRPLERLSTAMKKSSTSGTYEKIEHAQQGKDELAEIGRTFNSMMESLETNYKKQEQFVSNASHELKTPLTVIESYAKLLLRRGFSNEKVAQEALDAIAAESSRMNDLIVQMLELAKNKENATVSISQVNVSLLLENTAQQMAQSYNRTYEIKVDALLLANTDEQKLKQLLFILLDNARKYSEDHVIVTATKQSAAILISIQDFGEGIAQDQLPHLFDRFYRVKKDRNRKTGGTGLGLAIAKELAERLHIEIGVESELGVGTCFTLLLPSEFKSSKEVGQ